MDSEFNYIQQGPRDLWYYVNKWGELEGGWKTRETCETEFEVYKEDLLECHEGIDDGY